jgi:hypothetical protein
VDTLRKNKVSTRTHGLSDDYRVLTFISASIWLSRQIGMLSGKLKVAGESLDWLHASDSIANGLFLMPTKGKAAQFQ